MFCVISYISRELDRKWDLQINMLWWIVKQALFLRLVSRDTRFDDVQADDLPALCQFYAISMNMFACSFYVKKI